MLKRLAGKNEYYFLVNVNCFTGLTPEVLDGTDQVKILWQRGEDTKKAGTTEPISLQRASSVSAIGKVLSTRGQFDKSPKTASGFKSKSFILRISQKDEVFWTKELDMAQYLVTNQRNEAREELEITGWAQHPGARLILDIRTGPDGDEGETLPFKVDTPVAPDSRTRTISRKRGTGIVGAPTSSVIPSPNGSIVISSRGSVFTSTNSDNIEFVKKQNDILKEELQSKRQEMVSMRAEIDRLKELKNQNGDGLIHKMQEEIDDLKEKLLEKSGYVGYDEYGDDNDATELKNKVNELEKQLNETEELHKKSRDELKKENDQLKIQLDHVTEKLENAERRLKEKDSEYSSFSVASHGSESDEIELKQLRVKIDQIEKERDTLDREVTSLKSGTEIQLRSQKDTLEEQFANELFRVEENNKLIIEQLERKWNLEKVSIESQLNSVISGRIALEDDMASLRDQLEVKSSQEQEALQRLETVKRQIESLKNAEQEALNTVNQLKQTTDVLTSDLKKAQQNVELVKMENNELKKSMEAKDQQIMDLRVRSTQGGDSSDDVKRQLEKLIEQEQTIHNQKTELLKLQKQIELSTQQMKENQSTIVELRQSLQTTEQKLKTAESKSLELQVNIDHLSKRSVSSGSQTEQLKDEMRDLKELLRQRDIEIKQAIHKSQSLVSQLERAEQENQLVTQKKESLEEKLKELKEERQSILEQSKGAPDLDTVDRYRKAKRECDRLSLENERLALITQQAQDKFEKASSEKRQHEDRIVELQKHIKELKLENADLLQGNSSNGQVDSEIVTKLQQKIDRLETEKEDLISQVENQTNEVITLRQQLKNSTSTIVKLKRQLNSSQESLSSTHDFEEERTELTERLHKLTEENKKLRADLRTLKDALKQRQDELAAAKKQSKDKALQEKDQEDRKQINIEHYQRKRSKSFRIVPIKDDLSTKERMILDPIGSLKSSVLSIIDFYESRIEATEGDLMSISNGLINHDLTRMVNLLLCEALSCVFRTGFAGPFWFFTTPHPWHLIEEIAALYKTSTSAAEKHFVTPEALLGAKLSGSVKYINVEMQPDSTSVPYTLEEIKFRALVIHCVNQQNLHDMMQFIFSHKTQLSRYYTPQDALVMDSGSQKKLIHMLTLLCKLPFAIPIASVVNETGSIAIQIHDTSAADVKAS